MSRPDSDGESTGGEPATGEPPARVLLVINPRSGSGNGRRAGELARQALSDHRLTVLHTRAEDPVAQVRAVLDGTDDTYDALVVAGGDGMVHLGANLVAGTVLPLGIVPAGTGNDIAREFGVPVGDPAAAIETVRQGLARGSVRAVDAVRWSTADRSGWYLGVLAAGLDAIVNERANRWTWLRGRIRYDIATLRELAVMSTRRYRLEIDGRTTEQESVLVAVGNIAAYGGGLRICHGADPDDGLLDVLIGERMGRATLLGLYRKLPHGGHLAHPGVRLVQGRSVRIEADGIVAYADGERLDALPITCSVVPGAVRLLVAPHLPA